MTHRIDNFYDAYHFLYGHPLFFYKGKMADHNEPGFDEALSIMVMKVSPTTNRIEDDRTLNTKTAVWLECGPWLSPTDEWENQGAWAAHGVPCHDTDLDCGGDTFEEAILNLAKLVMDRDGDYDDYTICSHCLKNRPAPGGRDSNEHWFCSDACEFHGEYTYEFGPEKNGTREWIPTNKNCEHFRD